MGSRLIFCFELTKRHFDVTIRRMIKDWHKRLEYLLAQRGNLISEQGIRGAGRNKEALRLNCAIWRARKMIARGPQPKKPRKPRRPHSECKISPHVINRKRKRQLSKDLKILAWVMRGIRYRLEFPEKNRQRSLQGYHRRSGEINEARREQNFRESGPLRMATTLQKLFSGRRAALLSAAKRVLTKRNAAEQKLARILRRRFNKAVKLHQSSSYILRVCGCSLSDLRKHLESLFKPGMTWENRGFHGWHIDHIKPLAKFDLNNPDCQKRVFHYTNLQPLWKDENFAKRDKV